LELGDDSRYNIDTTAIVCILLSSSRTHSRTAIMDLRAGWSKAFLYKDSKTGETVAYYYYNKEGKTRRLPPPPLSDDAEDRDGSSYGTFVQAADFSY
jgi:hypothetical protein